MRRWSKVTTVAVILFVLACCALGFYYAATRGLHEPA